MCVCTKWAWLCVWRIRHSCLLLSVGAYIAHKYPVNICSGPISTKHTQTHKHELEKKKMKATQRGHIALISYSCVDQVDIYNSIGTMAITELAWKCMEVSSKGLLSNVYIHLIVTIVYTGAWFANAVVVVLVKIRPYFHNLHPTATGTVYLHKSLLLLHLSFHFLYVCLVFGRQVSLVLVQRTCIMKIV